VAAPVRQPWSHARASLKLQGQPNVKAKNMMEIAVFNIAGMEHEGCADQINALLGEIPGVGDVRVSLRDAQVSLQLDPQLVSTQAVLHALHAAGYPSHAEAPAPRGQCANCCGGGGCGKQQSHGSARHAHH
jgi:copper chaperone CopZ